MRSTITALALLAAAAPAFAQETAPAEGTEAPAAEAPAAEAPATEAPAAEAPAQAPAAEAPATVAPAAEAPAAPAPADGVGQPYVKAEHADWDIRCIKTEDGNDPCQLYQLLEDDKGNKVAEISFVPFGPAAEGDIVARASITTPLETFLAPGVEVAIDTSEPRRFPFALCTPAACVAQINFPADRITALKRGNKATVTISPLAAPEVKIPLTVSLTGFTAGYDSLETLLKEQAEAAPAPSGN